MSSYFVTPSQILRTMFVALTLPFILLGAMGLVLLPLPESLTAASVMKVSSWFLLAMGAWSLFSAMRQRALIRLVAEHVPFVNSALIPGPLSLSVRFDAYAKARWDPAACFEGKDRLVRVSGAMLANQTWAQLDDRKEVASFATNRTRTRLDLIHLGELIPRVWEVRPCGLAVYELNDGRAILEFRVDDPKEGALRFWLEQPSVEEATRRAHAEMAQIP